MTFIQRLYRKSRFIYAYLKSLLLGGLRNNRYDSVESFILFVGYPRSGHTLVAALLDAHPEIVMSIEWAALSHLKMGYTRNQMYYSIERNARLFTNRLNNTWTGYSYKVPGMWQGKYKTIKHIGDKLAGQTTMMLLTDPELLDKLEQKISVPIKIIHVIRNPYDTITTIAKRAFEKSGSKGELNTDFLASFIDKYFVRAAVVKKLKDAGEFEILDLYHEDIIENRGSALTRLVDFLEVEITDNYITRCSESIYKKPHKSRLEFDWSDDLKIKVRENLAKYSFMEHYRFED